MTTIKYFYPLLVAALIIVSSLAYSQNNEENSEVKKAAKEIIDNSGPCALISLDENGAPRARAMDAFPVEDDFVVWFGTNANSRKVEQIKKDSRVTVYYLSEDASGYVVISGKATLVNDSKLKNTYWKESWESFYPENKENYLLIKVTPLWMEVLSPPHNIYNDSITWTPPVVEFGNID